MRFLTDSGANGRSTAAVGYVAPCTGTEDKFSPVGNLALIPADAVYYLGMSLQHADVAAIAKVGDEVMVQMKVRQTPLFSLTIVDTLLLIYRCCLSLRPKISASASPARSTSRALSTWSRTARSQG